MCAVNDHRGIRDDHFASGADRRNAVTLNNHRLARFDAVTIHPNQIDIDEGNSRFGTQRPISGLLSGRGVSHAQDEDAGESNAARSSQHGIIARNGWPYVNCEQQRPSAVSPTQAAIHTSRPRESHFRRRVSARKAGY